MVERSECSRWLNVKYNTILVWLAYSLKSQCQNSLQSRIWRGFGVHMLLWNKLTSCFLPQYSLRDNMILIIVGLYQLKLSNYDQCSKVCLNLLTQYSFYVMESMCSSNYTCNIHRPSTREKEVSQTVNTMGKIAKRRQLRKCTHAQIQILANFYSITQYFATKKIRIFRAIFIAFPPVEYP